MIQHASTTFPANAPQNRGLTAFPLKVLAIVGMTCNHACYIYWDYLPPEVLCVLFGFGGLTFPIMAFLLVEGYRHTSNVARYARRLLVFALVAQVPFGMFLSPGLNVLFTLLVCLGLLYAYDHMTSRMRFWMVFVLVTALTVACDWGILAPCLVMVLRMLPTSGGASPIRRCCPLRRTACPRLNSFLPCRRCKTWRSRCIRW